VKRSMYGIPDNSLIPSLLVDNRAKETGQQLNATEDVVSMNILGSMISDAVAKGDANKKEVSDALEDVLSEVVKTEKDRLIIKYKQMKKADLQEIARERGVSTEGKKDDIIARILLGGGSSQPKITDVLPAEKPKPPKAGGKKGGQPATSKK